MNIFQKLWTGLKNGWLAKGSLRINAAPQKTNLTIDGASLYKGDKLMVKGEETCQSGAYVATTQPPGARYNRTPEGWQHEDTGRMVDYQDSVLFVTTDDARRLINSGKIAPPSEELKAITREAMLQQMVKDQHQEIVKQWSEESDWKEDEIQGLVGNTKDAQQIARDPGEANSFNDLSKNPPKQTHPLRAYRGSHEAAVEAEKERKDKLAKTKADMKSAIPAQQATRAKSIKKKKRATSTAAKRKTK